MKNTVIISMLFLLAACVPQSTAQKPPLVEGPVSFYPAQPGVEWTYLTQLSSPGDPPYRITILGGGSFGGQPAIRYRFFGWGQDRIYYRQISVSGVRLFGYEEVVTNGFVSYDPPIQEYPAEGALSIGARWGGATRQKTEIRADGKVYPGNGTNFEYTYTVLGKSTVNVPAGTFEVFRIRLELRGAQDARVTYEIWFAPKVGEIYNSAVAEGQGGILLSDRNFR